MKTRVCSCCEKRKPRSEFYLRTDGRQAGNLSSWCKRCLVAKADARSKANPGDRAIRAAKHRAAKKELPYDLDDYKTEIKERILKGCELSGLPFTIDGPRSWDSPSIDRIKPELGYVYGNIRIIMWCLNSLFGHWGEHGPKIAVRAWLEREYE